MDAERTRLISRCPSVAQPGTRSGMKIKDCVALVTGGNRGIGEAFVRALLERNVGG